MEKLSLRERKKIETRQAIIDAATSLFASDGFEKTTLAEIAELAHVSQRTIFSYFPSKEAIIFYHVEKTIAALSEHLDNRDKSISVMDSLKTLTLEKEPRKDHDARQKLIESSSVLKDYSNNVLVQVERKLAEVFANENNLPLDSIQAYLVAAVCRGMIDYIINKPNDQQAAEIALKFIEAGLKATH